MSNVLSCILYLFPCTLPWKIRKTKQHGKHGDSVYRPPPLNPIQAALSILQINSSTSRFYEDIKAIPAALASNRTVIELDLSNLSCSLNDLQNMILILNQDTTIKKLLVFRNRKFLGTTILSNLLIENHTLTFLDLSSNAMTGDDVQDIARGLKENKALHTLDLNNNKLGDEGVKGIAESLKYNFSLSSLFLGCNCIGAEGLGLLSIALRVNHCLTILDLSGNDIEVEGSKMIGHALIKNQTLTKLILRDNNIDDAGTKELCIGLNQNETLTTLDLRNNELGDDGAEEISHTLERHQSLIALDLGWNSIGISGAKAIGNALMINEQLQTLLMTKNHIQAEGAEALIRAKALTTLIIRDNGIIVGQRWKELETALRHTKTLTTLNLANYMIDSPLNNTLGLNGIKAIAKVLQLNELPLTALDLSSNSIGCNGFKEIGMALKQNTTLTTLNVKNNLIDAEGVTDLAFALIENNTTLTVLNLSENKIADEGATQLAMVIKANKTLTTLELYYNSIGVNGIKAIAASLVKNKTLVYLQLSGNDAKNEGVQEIGKALKQNKALHTLLLKNYGVCKDGVKEIGQALTLNTTLRTLYLFCTLDEEGIDDLETALKQNKTLTTLGVLLKKNGTFGKVINRNRLDWFNAYSKIQLAQYNLRDFLLVVHTDDKVIVPSWAKSFTSETHNRIQEIIEKATEKAKMKFTFNIFEDAWSSYKKYRRLLSDEAILMKVAQCLSLTDFLVYDDVRQAASVGNAK
eukprot:Awhi_evm1s14848